MTIDVLLRPSPVEEFAKEFWIVSVNALRIETYAILSPLYSAKLDIVSPNIMENQMRRAAITKPAPCLKMCQRMLKVFT